MKSGTELNFFLIVPINSERSQRKVEEIFISERADRQTDGQTDTQSDRRTE